MNESTKKSVLCYPFKKRWWNTGRTTVGLQLTIELLKTTEKEGILKAQEKWLLLYKGTLVRLTADCSLETIKARRHWDDVFKVLKEKISTKNSISATLSFKNQGDINRLTDRKKRELTASRSALQERVKELLFQVEMKEN